MIADTYEFGPVSSPVISSLETVIVQVQVNASLAGVQVNPTTLTLTYALVSAAVSPTGSFESAAWSTQTYASTPAYYAEATLDSIAIGEYDLWYKIVDGSLEPVYYAGRIQSR